MIIKDVKNSRDVAHWRAHTTQVLKISFSSSGLKVLTSTLGSNSFLVWDLTNITDKQPSLLYVLSRGYTPACLYDITWTKNDSWLSISTSHGTSHLYFLNPFMPTNTTPINPEIRVKRPLEPDRRDFLSYITAFIHPIEILHDSAMLSMVSGLSTNVLTIDLFEIAGTLDCFQKIVLVQSYHVPIENGEGQSECEFSNLFTYLNTNSSARTHLDNSWNTNIIVDCNKRNDISFDDEWTVQVEGVQMEDII